MAEMETDWEKRYNDQQRYVRDLEAKNKEYEVGHSNWQTVSTDPRFKPHYDAIWGIVEGKNGQAKAEAPQQPEGPPKWFVEWQEKDWKPVKADYETKRQKAVREWTEKVEAREKELSEKYPELAQGAWFGNTGKLNSWMARTGEDDIEKAIRANLEPKYWYTPDETPSEQKKPKREPSERPVEGKAPSKTEEPVTNEAQALNRARQRFEESVAGRG